MKKFLKEEPVNTYGPRNFANFKIINGDFVAFYSGKTESFRRLKDSWEFIDRPVNMLRVELMTRLNEETGEYELVRHTGGEYPERQKYHS